MTGKYPFPDDIRDPNRKDPNPFAGEDPTLDDDPIQSDSPYAVGDKSTQYKPQYSAVLTDRSGLTMVVGVLGLAASLCGWLATINTYFAALIFMPLFALAGSLPALLISMSDLRAMREGAMRKENRSWSRVSCFIGLLGFLSSGLFGAYWVWYMWYEAW